MKSSAIAAACAALSLAACGGDGRDDGDDGPPQQFEAQILSDPQFDGDIEQTAPDAFTITQGMSGTVQNVLAGTDPVFLTEFRAFLDFPLTGAGGVPGSAIIDSAFLEVFVDNLDPATGSIPVRVELVTFQPPTLLATDFDRVLQPQLGAVLVSGDVNSADVGHFVPVDVTALMIKAQQLGLVDFQVRILEDLGSDNLTLLSIDDTTGSARPQRAPVLTVDYH